MLLYTRRYFCKVAYTRHEKGTFNWQTGFIHIFVTQYISYPDWCHSFSHLSVFGIIPILTHMLVTMNVDQIGCCTSWYIPHTRIFFSEMQYLLWAVWLFLNIQKNMINWNLLSFSSQLFFSWSGVGMLSAQVWMPAYTSKLCSANCVYNFAESLAVL
jgi:hypothetical protein